MGSRLFCCFGVLNVFYSRKNRGRFRWFCMTWMQVLCLLTLSKIQSSRLIFKNMALGDSFKKKPSQKCEKIFKARKLLFIELFGDPFIFHYQYILAATLTICSNKLLIWDLELIVSLSKFIIEVIVFNLNAVIPIFRLLNRNLIKSLAHICHR